jgi:hypothetical protein
MTDQEKANVPLDRPQPEIPVPPAIQCPEKTMKTNRLTQVICALVALAVLGGCASVKPYAERARTCAVDILKPAVDTRVEGVLKAHLEDGKSLKDALKENGVSQEQAETLVHKMAECTFAQ